MIDADEVKRQIDYIISNKLCNVPCHKCCIYRMCTEILVRNVNIPIKDMVSLALRIKEDDYDISKIAFEFFL